MSDTRLDLPAVRPPGRGPRPFWLAPLCTLIVASPFALAAGAGAAWLTGDDPALALVQAEPGGGPPFPVAPTTTAAPPTAAPSSTYSEPVETAAPAETTRAAPKTVTRWRTPSPVAPAAPPAVTRTPEPTAPPSTTTSTPATSSSSSAPSTNPDEVFGRGNADTGSTP